MALMALTGVVSLSNGSLKQQPHTDIHVLYRYDYMISYDDYYDIHPSPEIKLLLVDFNVVKHTPTGYKIDMGYNTKQKFVVSAGKKRYAYPTKEEALRSLIARKRVHIKILNRQSSEMSGVLREAEWLLSKLQ